METVNLFGAQRGRAAQAAAWAMEKERFSTQEMANALAVSTPTAITLLRRLEGHGLVQPCGEFSSTGGRKPRAWSACPGARYVVGADITLRHVSLVAVDLSGQVTRTQTRTLAFTRTPAYFRALAAFISELCAELPRQSVLGVGLSIPGIIGSSIITTLTAIAGHISFSQLVTRRMITIAMSIAPIAGAKNIACLSAVTGLVISSSMTMPIEHSAIVSR